MTSGPISNITNNNILQAQLNKAFGEASYLAGDNAFTGSNSFTKVKTVPVLVGGLVAAATAGAGSRAFVTDATSATFGAAAVGGSTHKVPVWCDGTGWFIG